MDDTAEKLRRNFVGVAAVLLAMWWLKAAPPAQLAIFGVALGSIDPGRLWGLGIALLLYTGARYHFSAGRIESSGEYAADHRTRLDNRARSYIRKVYAARANEYSRSKGSKHITSPYEYLVVVGERPSNWVGFYYACVEWEHRPHEFPTDGFEPGPDFHDYMPVPFLKRCRIKLSAYLVTATYSHGAFEVLVPYALGAAALSVCVFRLAL